MKGQWGLGTEALGKEGRQAAKGSSAWGGGSPQGPCRCPRGLCPLLPHPPSWVTEAGEHGADSGKQGGGAADPLSSPNTPATATAIAASLRPVPDQHTGTHCVSGHPEGLRPLGGGSLEGESPFTPTRSSVPGVLCHPSPTLPGSQRLSGRDLPSGWQTLRGRAPPHPPAKAVWQRGHAGAVPQPSRVRAGAQVA